mgnify:CR=1 FL=1
MKAAVCHQFGAPLGGEDVALRGPGPGEIEVKTAACAICHSDIAYGNGDWGGGLPLVLGHEASGHVVAVGDGVSGYRPGQPVLVTLIRACGTCAACAEDNPTSCDKAWDSYASPLTTRDGAPLGQGLKTAAFAERMVVHTSQCTPLPPDMDLVTASLLACGVITGFGAVTNSARLQPGQSAVVIGAGGVGINAIQGAALAGARPLVAVDISDARLTDAKRFGATHGVLAGQPSTVAEVRAATPASRGVDFAFVSVGKAEVMAEAIDMLAPGGAVVLVGIPPTGASISVDPSVIASMNQRIIGSRMGQTLLRRDVPALIEHYRAGRLKLDELVTARWQLSEINEALSHTRAGKALRNVIVF